MVRCVDEMSCFSKNKIRFYIDFMIENGIRDYFREVEMIVEIIKKKFF